MDATTQLLTGAMNWPGDNNPLSMPVLQDWFLELDVAGSCTKPVSQRVAFRC